MASSMIHYIVSHLIADRIGIKNLANVCQVVF